MLTKRGTNFWKDSNENVTKPVRQRISFFPQQQQQQQQCAYAIVAPHSSHGGDDFDDCMDTFGVEKLCVDESTIFVWTIGTFVVVSVVSIDVADGACTQDKLGNLLTS